MLLVLLLTAGLLLLLPAPAYACTCPSPGTPRKAMEDSAAVFSARVIDIAEVNARSGPSISSADPVKVTFQVERVWKGDARPMLQAITARSEVSCGYEFEKGYKYLVYARGEASDLRVSLCSRTRPIIFALQDLDELGEGTNIAEETGPEESSGRRSFGCNFPLQGNQVIPDLSLVAITLGLVGLRFLRRP